MNKEVVKSIRERTASARTVCCVRTEVEEVFTSSCRGIVDQAAALKKVCDRSQRSICEEQLLVHVFVSQKRSLEGWECADANDIDVGGIYSTLSLEA